LVLNFSHADACLINVNELSIYRRLMHPPGFLT
jgi:hypothetical protein